MWGEAFLQKTCDILQVKPLSKVRYNTWYVLFIYVMKFDYNLLANLSDKNSNLNIPITVQRGML